MVEKVAQKSVYESDERTKVARKHQQTEDILQDGGRLSIGLNFEGGGNALGNYARAGDAFFIH